jgi:predicted O-methyltransferase YrrM
MNTRTIAMKENVYNYMLDMSLREHPVQQELREFTGKMRNANMQIAPEQGQFMQFLVKSIGARRTLEIGTFTGYSALAVALALPEDGMVVACDFSTAYGKMAKEFWNKAGVAHKIHLRLAPALKTLDRLIENGKAGKFDFAFIDADKVQYDDYYERCLTLLRPGGIIAIDNVLWSGKVASPAQDEDTMALKAINEKLRADSRIDLSMVPIGDGLSLARKRTNA